MNRREIVTIGLVACLGFSVLGFTADKPGATAPTDEGQVVAYYFHGKVRCRTCLKIEATAEEVLREGFSDDLKAKRLEWRVVDYDVPANEHFIKDFQLVSSSLVLVEVQNGKQGRFKTLDKVWQYVHHEEQFKAYVRDEVLDFLRGANG